jgi:hypothetical protein
MAMRWQTLIAPWIACCGLTFAVPQCRAVDEARSDPPPDQSKLAAETTKSAGLAEGWNNDIEVPESRDEKTGNVYQVASKLKLWVEQGWLVARYERPDRGLEWQVVLAQSTNRNPPETRIDRQPIGFEIT